MLRVRIESTEPYICILWFNSVLFYNCYCIGARLGNDKNGIYSVSCIHFTGFGYTITLKLLSGAR